MVKPGDQVNYNGRKWKVLAINGESVHLKCMSCSSREVHVKITDL